MKRIRLVSIALLLTTLAASVASAQPATGVDRREWRQHQRIRHGLEHRQLSRRELIRLRAGQRHVQRMEWRARRDGHVDRFERRRLMRAQDRESLRIYRLKHNRESMIL